MPHEAPTVEEVEFHALRNALYHTARRQRLESDGRWINLIIILGGASSVADVVARDNLSWLLGIVIAAAGSLQLVFDFAGRANAHARMQRRYYELLARVKEMGESSAEARRSLMAEVARISGDETPIYRALDAVAFNEATDSLYGEERADCKLQINWYQYFFRHNFHFNGTSFPSRVPRQPNAS